MRPGRDADHSPPSSAAVMEGKSYASTQPLGHTGPVTGTLYTLLERNSARKIEVMLYPVLYVGAAKGAAQ